MKLAPTKSSRALQTPKTVARQLFFVIPSLALLAAAPLCSAAPIQDPVAQVKQLASQNLSQADYAAAVADLVKDDPTDAEIIMAEAVKDEPKYACAVVKAGILALQPQNGTIDPKVVASIVVTIVETIQNTNPDLVQQIISCALAVDHDAGPEILNALAGLFGTHGSHFPPWQFGPPIPPGNGHNPGFPTPTPPRTPPPVTGYKPI